MGERDRYQSGYERDRGRRDYGESYEHRQRDWQPAENDWRDDRNRYAGYYAERQYGTRGTDEREQGSRYGTEEDFRRGPQYETRQRYGEDNDYRNNERYGRDWGVRRDSGGYSNYERTPGSSYTPGPYQSRPPRTASASYTSQLGQRDYRSRDNQNDYREQGDREHESFGDQVREAGQRIARSVKRVFRGPKGYKRSDERIREDISDRLGDHEYLDCTDVEVSVSNGEVTLTGTVRTRQEKFLAEEISDDVSGVNDVHNQLRVKRDTTSAANVNTTSSIEAARPRNARA